MNNGAIYNSYAAIYDATGQERFGAYLALLTMNWLQAQGVTPHSALDLACGTGGATLALARAGVATLGIDRSPEMLRIARGRARSAGLDVVFAAGDMRELRMENEAWKTLLTSHFSLPNSYFSLVTCFGDSLNYLLDAGDLLRVFGGIAGMLMPGGYLVFDVNTETAFKQWDERDLVTYDSADCLVYNRLEFSRANRLGRGQIVWFVRGDDQRWWRGEEIHYERAWSDAEIRAALDDNGFELAARLNVEGLPIASDAELPERAIYVARMKDATSPPNPLSDAER